VCSYTVLPVFYVGTHPTGIPLWLRFIILWVLSGVRVSQCHKKEVFNIRGAMYKEDIAPN
jgi:hypothetical protein